MKHSMALSVATRLLGLIVFAVAILEVISVNAQSPVRHSLIRGDMPPGLAADYSRMSNPKLDGHMQPVRIICPMGSQIEVASEDGFIHMGSSRASVGMKIGPVYRMKVTSIPRYFGRELYPSVEILNRLNPPKDLSFEFPIEIVITQDDLTQAIEGRLVTKVIYLENPATALPHRHNADEQPFFDVGGSEDPLRAAEKLGRPMAILRIGSRIPLASDRLEEFNFYAPTPTLIPEPQNVNEEPQWDAFDESSPLIPGNLIPAADDQ